MTARHAGFELNRVLGRRALPVTPPLASQTRQLEGSVYEARTFLEQAGARARRVVESGWQDNEDKMLACKAPPPPDPPSPTPRTMRARKFVGAGSDP